MKQIEIILTIVFVATFAVAIAGQIKSIKKEIAK